uniref:CASP-like protein n=1 Tax=Hordeum vulgare subsp. vulgare TaxID=112509 RepID=A0A8I6Y5J2_HORVV
MCSQTLLLHSTALPLLSIVKVHPSRARRRSFELVYQSARTMVAAGFVFVPGTWSGFALRVGQCGFSATSGLIMLTSLASLTYSRAYMYLIFVMVLHFVWSLVQAVVYLRTLLAGEDIHRPGIAFFLALGDGAVVLLTSSAVSASAMVTVLFVNDTGACGSFPELACDRYQLSVVLGSMAWFLQATSAFSNLCLMIKVATQQPHLVASDAFHVDRLL